MKKNYTFLLLFLFIVSTTTAQTTNWVGGAAGLWSVPSNWSGGVVPTAADWVGISAGTVTVNISTTIDGIHSIGSSGTSASLVINAGVTLTATGKGVILSNSGSTLDVSGILAITGTTNKHGVNNTTGGSVNINTGGELNITGVTNASGIFSGGTIVNDGILHYQISQVRQVSIYPQEA